MPYLGKSPSQGVRTRFQFTPNAGTTSISGADANGITLTFTDGNYVDVYLNGVMLKAGTDYNTTTANQVTLSSGTAASDVVDIIVYDTFSLFGGTLEGNVKVNNGTFNVTGAVDFDSTLNVDGALTATSASYSSTISLTDSDVAHGMTGLLPTATYGQLAPESGTEGGLRITTATEGATAYSVTATSTTPSTDGNGAVFRFRASKKSGTSEQALADTDDLMTIGNVGVEKVTIKGNGDTTFDGSIVKTAGSGTFTIETSGSSSVNLNASSSMKFTVGNSDSHQFVNGSDTVLVIDSSGKTGMNVTSPSGILHVKTPTGTSGSNNTVKGLVVQEGGFSTANILEIQDSVGGEYLSVDGSGNLFVDATTLVVQASDNRVGIGSTNPHAILDVKPCTDGRILFVNNSGDPDIVAVNNANSAYANLKLEGATITGRISGNERFKIDTNGNTLVRESDLGGTPSSAVALQVGNNTNNDMIHTRNKTSSGSVFHMFMKFDNIAPDDTTSYFLQGADSSTQRFFIYSNGNIVNHDNSYGAISDIKLKEQIKDASSQWDDVKALRIRKYKMKEQIANKGDSDNLWKLGVVAQEVEASGMSGLVNTNKDFDQETKEDLGTTTKTVKYSILYMKAVKALQEAMTRIETLEAKVAKLEGA